MVRWILDIDGTLAAPSERRMLLLPSSDHNCLLHLSASDIDQFMDPELMLDDTPTPWCSDILRRSAGSPRCFLTARCEKLRPVTISWLHSAGWEAADGFMRPDSATTVSSLDVKMLALKHAIDWRETILVDDDEQFLSAATSTFANVRGIYSPRWFEEITAF